MNCRFVGVWPKNPTEQRDAAASGWLAGAPGKPL